MLSSTVLSCQALPLCPACALLLVWVKGEWSQCWGERMLLNKALRELRTLWSFVTHQLEGRGQAQRQEGAGQEGEEILREGTQTPKKVLKQALSFSAMLVRTGPLCAVA